MQIFFSLKAKPTDDSDRENRTNFQPHPIIDSAKATGVEIDRRFEKGWKPLTFRPNGAKYTRGKRWKQKDQTGVKK